MTRTGAAFAALVVAAGLASAADDPAAALEKLGAKVTRTKDVATQADVDATKFAADDFRTLGRCNTLKRLVINGKTLNDDTLPLLAGLTALEELSTNATALSDDGYKHFAAFQNLKSLALFHPSWAKEGFTGRGLAHLKPLAKLERLTFAGATTGDDALAAVGELTQLKEFSTWHTAQTQAGNAHLTKLPNLVALRFGQRLPKGTPPPPPSFDAATIATFAKIPTLERLDLFEARFTAAGLEPLKNLPKLKKLSMQTVDISDADLEAVRKALPGVTIDFKPMTAEDREASLVKKLKI